MEKLHNQDFIPSETLPRESAATVVGLLVRHELSTLWDPTISADTREKSFQRYELANYALDLSVAQEAESMTDPLTKLYNKASFSRQFDELLDFTWRNNARCGLENSLSILFIDLNGFKAVNDNIGHNAGDEVLIEVASRLAGSIRKYDKAHRFGGDEFILIINGLSATEVEQKINELKEDVSQPITLRDGQSVNVGAAIGYVSFDHEQISRLSLLSADERAEIIEEERHIADQKMYEDKAQMKQN